MVIGITLKQFGQIGVESRPIVHLYVDVVGIVTVPGGQLVLVPYALQSGWESTFAGTADKQITSVMKKQLFQIRILLSGLVCSQQAVGGKIAFGADIQLHPFGKRGEVVNVSGTQLAISFLGGFYKALGYFCVRVVISFQLFGRFIGKYLRR